jgi:EAL domain-containing protein (putative c-di-GMP-specific phosphodiesterase class I)
LLERILDRGTLRTVYQPIVDLASGQTVAYEALARGPKGPLESPAALFHTADRSGLLAHLEWACRRTAIEGAINAELGSVTSLFVNVEPRITGSAMPPGLEAVMRLAGHKLRVVLELTERDLTRRPADLLRLVRWARANWWGVALDDVGADPASLALLPFVRPDVVKLDMALVQEAHDETDRATVRAVRDHCFRTGATILAEGIETDAQAEVARQLGATLGQGWLYGRPGELGRSAGLGTPVRLLDRVDSDEGATPFALLEGQAPVIRARQSELDGFSRRLERQAVGKGTPVLLSSFGHAGLFTPAMAARYEDLAPSCAFTGIAGVGVVEPPGSAVRYSAFGATDPLAREWAVTAVGPGFASALVARALVRPESGDDPELELIVTEDRLLVLAAARALMARVVPAA